MLLDDSGLLRSAIWRSSVYPEAVDSGYIEYREVPGYPNYLVGDDGSVWSLGHRDRRHRLPLRRRTQQLHHGYRTVMLYRDNHGKRFLVHRLVMLAFRGPCPEGMEVCHRDGNGSHNWLSNLRYGTKASNESDKSCHGTLNQGERNGAAKLVAAQVLAIRAALAEGQSQKNLAAVHGITQTMVSHIKLRKAWKHV